MRKISVYHVDAFTAEAFGGNPAGVVPEADDLTVQEMQKIANELNLPESAFLMPSHHPEADYRIRFFTPTEEINFCGHATVGSAWLLATEYGWAEKAEQILFETNVGLVPVTWSKSEGQLSGVTMTQIAPKVGEIAADKEELARLVGIAADDIDGRYPIKLGNTGNWHLLIPVKTRKAIDSAQPIAELARFNRAHDVSTTHLFTFDAKEGYDLHTRDFAPAVGIPEDPVTGAANGALAGYLILEGILAHDQTHHLKIAQGDAVRRPGTLHVTITPGETAPAIQVQGAAHVTIAGTLRLPQ